MKHARYVGHVLYGNANQSKREHFYEHYMIFLRPWYTWRLSCCCSDYDTAKHAFYFSLEPKDLAKKTVHNLSVCALKSSFLWSVPRAFYPNVTSVVPIFQTESAEVGALNGNLGRDKVCHRGLQTQTHPF